MHHLLDTAQTMPTTACSGGQLIHHGEGWVFKALSPTCHLFSASICCCTFLRGFFLWFGFCFKKSHLFLPPSTTSFGNYTNYLLSTDQLPSPMLRAALQGKGNTGHSSTNNCSALLRVLFRIIFLHSRYHTSHPH